MNTQPFSRFAAPRNFPFTAGDLNIYHARLADQQVTYVLEFANCLDLDKLKTSLRLLHETLPALTCTVQRTDSRFRWVQRPNWQPNLSVQDDDSGQTQPEVLHFVSTLCDPERELPLKLLLLHSMDHDILCLKVDHVLADAGGLKSLLYLFAEAYAKGKLDPVANRNREFGQVFRRFSLLALFRAARTADLPKPGPALLAGPFDSSSVFLEHVCLDPEQFGRVRIAAKQVGATINDALLMALYRAIWDQA